MRPTRNFARSQETQTKMTPRIFKFILSTLLLASWLSLLIHQVASLPLDSTNSQQYTNSHEDAARFRSPFIVLMAKREVSIIQLPLIDNGNVTVVYQLQDSETNCQDASSADDAHNFNGNATITAVPRVKSTKTPTITTNSPSSATTSSRNDRHADARESEQMPRLESTSILGTNERPQQIASNSGPSSSSSGLLPPPSSKNQKEMGEDVTASAPLDEGNERETSRPRRETSGSSSNNLNGSGSGLGLGPGASATGEEGGAGDKHTASLNKSSVSESSPRNVTSARFENTTQGGTEDDKNGDVQFSDLDVHVALGYAFVADCKGRIHRFRLAVPSQRQDEPTSSWGSSLGSHDRALMDQSMLQSSNRATALESSAGRFDATSPRENSKFDEDRAVRANDDDANEFHDVTLDQSGRHPKASGSSELSSATSAGASSDGSSLDSSASTSFNQPNNFKPRIIWSRNKRGSGFLSADVSSSERPAADATAMDQDVGASTKLRNSSSNSNQVGSDSEQHMGSDSSGSEATSTDGQRQPTSEEGLSDEEAIEDEASADSTIKPKPEVKTEIAVDWLNNLLFVLDKYRLLVMDFDGNNELVLIDDFNANNRPVDIKVDPASNFIFWLQVGKFHNTIYKLDLSVLSMHSATERFITNRVSQSSAHEISSSDTAALISHHYAHPIVTNLPKHVKIFTIDNRKSKIYVPLPSPLEVDYSIKDQERVEASALEESNLIIQPNITSTEQMTTIYQNHNCTDASSSNGEILAYNLDGTDVGPLRDADEKGHLTSLDDMRDMTIDGNKTLIYWLTKSGKELFEEIKIGQASFQPAQHYLHGATYEKLVHVGSNQPRTNATRLNLGHLIHILANLRTSSRVTREPNSINPEVSYYGSEEGSSGLSRSPTTILGVTCLVILVVYMSYALIFQQRSRFSRRSRDSSVDGTSIGESHLDPEAPSGSFIATCTVSRWMPKSPNRTSNELNNRANHFRDNMDLEASISGTNGNAIDEHYGDQESSQTIIDLCAGNQLANLSGWPNSFHDISNKLYVPAEVLQDETLSSIRRIGIDQLEIEKCDPLGKGHFGIVLQGKITCSVGEVNRIMNLPSNAAISKPTIGECSSSGHGSSSSSSEFATANSNTLEPSSGDYLTPRSHSDYDEQICNSPRPDSYSSYYNSGVSHSSGEPIKTPNAFTRIQVAIKKLKEDASSEEKRDFLQEAKLLASFNHPNIVHLVGICLDRGSTLIVMELMLGGDLIRYMQENVPRTRCDDNLTEADLLKICLDIVDGCCYLKELNYIHRDIAARNCLVSSRKRDERVVKLADFGLARDIYQDSYYKKLNDSAMPLMWMAPECLIEQKFTSMSDVWSFGVVMWEVMSYCQEKPYAKVVPFSMIEHLSNGERLYRPEGCSEDIYELMLECWKWEPNDRPSFQECRYRLTQIRNGRC